ncbi:hypothetical protein [Shewanella sp. GD04112]|uniref:DUF6984 family protein n=1 Tax=Shewanella sp. GD04112 TaxID=2975434 RepID=UPI00244C099E|nr:hypothetical protein [Shewanella sp. GD04112]MDH0448288.1 hypothetical protein [Shewanella sp. GD04112]
MRTPTTVEAQILNELFVRAELPYDAKSLLVESMDDGRMGSLKIGINHSERRFGAACAEFELIDDDGKPVLFSLYLDKAGEPYELDAFKSDFSETILLQNNS